MLVDCNFLLYTADPHIRIIEEEGLMRFQFGVHVMADRGLFYHMRACVRALVLMMMRHGANTRMHVTVGCRPLEFQKGKERKHTGLNEAGRYIPLETSSSLQQG